jgi:hypothetical protein
MSKNRKFVRAIQNFYQQFSRKSPSTVKEQSLWLLRSFIVTKKRPDWVNAGFVLPTVAMVSLVVVLLTIAILFRSFERSKNVSNVRVNQVVLNAALPAIDRAKAKIDKLLNDPTLPRSTPSDGSLYTALTKEKKLAEYTFGDETPLAVKYDINGNDSIDNADDTELEKKEVKNTAWRFPVDTDNNGKFDSFTLYGIYFRSPSRGTNGKFDRARAPLDARTPPMDDGSLSGACAGAKGTSASLIGDSGWYKAGGNLKKSFFVYVATVPITDESFIENDKYETFKGNQGFSAVEYQQDQERIPIVNNAVVYEDDLEITPGAGLSLNGRIFTNSNLLTATIWDPIRLYQVSSPDSCFYEAEFSKIIVGGNLGYGRIFGSTRRNPVRVDLFDKGSANSANATIDNNARSANNTSAQIAYNAQAFAQRIDLQVQQALNLTTDLDDYSKDPLEVQQSIEAKVDDENNTKTVEEIRREELEAYFKKRTRKVPFADPVQTATTVTLENDGFDASGAVKGLRGPNQWIYPFDLSNNRTNYTGLSLFLDRLPATAPNKLEGQPEQFLGDRILLGNNLPAKWYDPDSNDFVGTKKAQKVLPEEEWDDFFENDIENQFRFRKTRVEQLVSLDGATKRNDFFEQEATKQPKSPLDNIGGMRVVTGAGIYVDGSTDYPRDANALFQEAPQWDTNFVDTSNSDPNRVWVNSLNLNNDSTKTPIIVWPDSMSMGDPTVPASRGDLLMRATAVYHYKDNHGKDQTPIACISSYYDPTNSITAQNNATANNSWVNPDAAPGVDGKSNNGVVYPSYGGGRSNAISTYRTELDNQARLVYPNGRFVNEPLRKAMSKVANSETLSISDNSAIDTAVCAIEILDGTSLTPDNSKIPHGAIYETSFLDARQVKSIENARNVADPTVNADYNLSLEQRQPLEVRVTVLDMDQLRQTTIGTASPTQEYLLPNSGIIYATRDDALPDLSAQPGTGQNNVDTQKSNIDRRKLISPTDYKVDPTRRPNGIMLINGERLDRGSGNNYRDEEKGLILATNVPAYIKGDFNFHAQDGNPNNPVEEFTDQLRDNDGNIDWASFYTRNATRESNFACRRNDPRLPNCNQGDTWRPASVIADAVTVLSDNFRFGFRNEGDFDLRNNAGNAVIPEFDFNGDGTVDSSDTGNETLLQIDLNGDGDTTDPQEILLADLNGDGDANDTAVSGENPVRIIAIRRILGFLDNSFLSSADWFDDGNNMDAPKVDFAPADREGIQSGSSYVNNFVTPIQRRVRFGEYVMEVCRTVPVERCRPQDWVVLVDDDNNATTPAVETRTNQLQVATSATTGTLANRLESGTTAQLANVQNQRFARRVAFLRDANNRLVLDQNGYPVPLGVNTNGRVTYFPYNNLSIPFQGNVFDPTATTTQNFLAFSRTIAARRPRTPDRTLWFRTADDNNFNNGQTTQTNYGNGRPLYFSNQLIQNPSFTAPAGNYREGTIEQPLLVPVLQIHMPHDEWTDDTTPNPGTDRDSLPDTDDRGFARDRNWLIQATPTTTNLVIVGGDTPAAQNETNGGLENFVRYLEQWQPIGNSNEFNHNLSGSLIQYKRSAYATAPWQIVRNGGTSIFGNDYPQLYRTNTSGGETPFYTPPSRQWGFDVGLLSQLPDLFAQTFTLPPTTEPDEFFREVNRDDKWVKTLLCAKTVNIGADGIEITDNNAVPDKQRPTQFCQEESSDL